MYSNYLILSVLAGAVLPFQALINGRLGLHIGGPIWAAAFSFFISTLALVGFQLFQRAAIPVPAQFASAPLWILGGGFLGAFYLASATMSAPRLGAAVFVSLMILGQLVASLLLDHFGVLTLEPHPVSLLRILGTGFLFVGAILVLRF